MGDCDYNGTCFSCTLKKLEYVETELNLTCCVKNSNSVAGWVRFIAKTPSECPQKPAQSHVIQAAILTTALVFMLLGILWLGRKKFRVRGYFHIPPPSPSSHRENEEQNFNPGHWEAIELDAVYATMEATTAL